ncbi:MAG: ATP-binding protein [Cyanobacteria bacterium P01_A01_bin.17]
MSKLLCHFLIGIPGAGKTTFAHQLLARIPQSVHISPDLIREQLYDDPVIQGDWSAIEHKVQQLFQDAIGREWSVIYDATNAERKWRTSFLRDNTPPPVHWLGWVFQTPVTDCIARNQNRERTVPMDVIIDYAQLLNQFPPTLSEGFYRILDVPLDDQGAVDIEKVLRLIEPYQ